MKKNNQGSLRNQGNRGLKKIAVVGLMICLSFATGCSKESKKETEAETKMETADQSLEEFMLQESIALTEKIDAMAEDTELMQLYITMDTLLEKGKIIGEQDYTTPVKAYQISYNAEDLIKFLSEESEITGEWSTERKELIENKVTASNIFNIINSQKGAEFLALSSLLTYKKGYQMPSDWKENCIIYLVYEGDYSSMTGFQKIGDGVIEGVSTIVETNEDLIEQLEQFGLKVTELKL
ncbi:hypothetical protein [Anaerosporobacter faecicola]|uniref:hypothetical protein n=1 Tax=Anaerosporobacter faecicola TaxID=2718714 RepID=UPI0014396E6A|nr:hypothetical protein [Anaerosporobacter faecicola]